MYNTDYVFSPLHANYKYDGLISDAVAFIEREQYLDENLWKTLITPFITREDSEDDGWRGEFWGKMMRGACLTYEYTKNEKLYDVLYQTVLELLDTQDLYGRISSYSVEHEFTGWDVWARKYVMTGLQHFYKICKNEQLKTKIISSIEKQFDYIESKVGEEKGKMSILQTSLAWGGLNSATILEPVVETYKLTGKNKYLDFAKGIIKTGGCTFVNFIDLINEGKYPYQCSITKAYEMMSFFEGVLAYYEVSGEKFYLDVVVEFIKKVKESEITIIGCAGCDGELFNNSVKEQTKKNDAFSLETCVAVTWVRVCYRLFRLTGNAKYIAEVENSAYNTLYGAINYNFNDQYDVINNKIKKGLPIDSYTPIVSNHRGLAIAGYKNLRNGSYYGCCVSIAGAGTALMPLSCVMQGENCIVFNHYENGQVKNLDLNGEKIDITISGVDVQNDHIKINFNLEKDCYFKVMLRKPSWAKTFSVSVDNEIYEAKDGYAVIERNWENKSVISICLSKELKLHYQDDKVAFSYGKYVLGIDSKKQEDNFDIDKTNLCELTKKGYSIKWLMPIDREQLRIKLQFSDNSYVILTDFASCGTVDYNSIIGVWFR